MKVGVIYLLTINQKNMKKLILLSIGILLTFVVNAQAEIAYDYHLGSENYPGVKKGEVFFILIPTNWYFDKEKDTILRPNNNLSSNEILQKNFESLGWRTGRIGDVAYSEKGVILEDDRPVFVNKEEFLERGFSANPPQWKINSALFKKYSPGSRTYPGIKKGEVYMFDISNMYYYDYKKDTLVMDKDSAAIITFNNLPFANKRLGKVAYDKNGKVIKGWLPLFVKPTIQEKKELIK